MSKKDSVDKVQEVMDKRLEKRKQEMADEARSEVQVNMDNTCFTVVQQPDKKGRYFLLAKINFDVKTMRAVVEDYVELDEKVIGMKYPIDQQNLKYYYTKIKKKGDKQ